MFNSLNNESLPLLTDITAIAILLIGFSSCSGVLLALTHFTKSHYQDLPLSRCMGLVLLFGLCGLQMAHFFWLYFDENWVSTPVYKILLFVIAPSFFLFSYPILVGQQTQQSKLIFKPVYLAHSIPVLLSPLLSNWLILPMAFLVGSAYLIWLACSVYKLRHARDNFQREISLLSGIFVIAIAVAVLGLVQGAQPGKSFFCFYSMAIGLAFFLVQIALSIRPSLSSEIRESAQASYINTTLSNVDSNAAITRLEAMINVEKIYIDSSLGLQSVADRLGLSAHQTSELFNVKLGKSFSRYLREQRIEAAKMMLREEPSASVMSIGLNVGFSSQSNFYEAFREIEGMPPGQYRKLLPKE